eukprot:403331341
MERLSNISFNFNDDDQWVYEYNLGSDQMPIGHIAIMQIKTTNGIQFTGEGFEERKPFEIQGKLMGGRQMGRQFIVKQTFERERDTDEESFDNKIVIGHIMPDGSLVGKWKHTQEADYDEQSYNGDFVIRNILNNQYSLFSEYPDFLRMKMENIYCKCKELIQKFEVEDSEMAHTCTLCESYFTDLYYSCDSLSQKKTAAIQCNFAMCKDCFDKINYLKKSEMITKILAIQDRSKMTSNIDYVRGIYRQIFHDQTTAKLSIQNRKEKDYRWFEVYHLNEKTIKFEKKEIIELYINQKKYNEGHFHEVKLCEQQREIQKNINPQTGRIEYKEALIDPHINWVLKNVKDRRHISEVPNDIAKQYLAMMISNHFNQVLKKVYSSTERYLKYIQPFLVLPLFKAENHYCYFEMESYMDADIRFDIYNRPNGGLEVIDTQHGTARMPNAFSHWTYEATGGLFMITDVQGWRIGKGKYVMTDPVVFSQKQGQLGLVDKGEMGMDNWFRNHKCNGVCFELPMAKDDELIQKCTQYLNTFKHDRENFKIQIETILDQFNNDKK